MGSLYKITYKHYYHISLLFIKNLTSNIIALISELTAAEHMTLKV